MPQKWWSSQMLKDVQLEKLTQEEAAAKYNVTIWKQLVREEISELEKISNGALRICVI